MMDLLDFGHSQSGDSGRSDCHYSGHDYDGHGLRIWNQGCAAKSSCFFSAGGRLGFSRCCFDVWRIPFTRFLNLYILSVVECFSLERFERGTRPKCPMLQDILVLKSNLWGGQCRLLLCPFSNLQELHCAEEITLQGPTSEGPAKPLAISCSCLKCRDRLLFLVEHTWIDVDVSGPIDQHPLVNWFEAPPI